MTPTDITLLRETLDLALSSDDKFPARFYEILFERHPELEALFTRNSRGAQIRSFGRKLVAIVDHIDDPEWTRRELGALSSSHVAYGVTSAMYAPVGDALVDTVREACGAVFTADAERVWREAYASIARAMND